MNRKNRGTGRAWWRLHPGYLALSIAGGVAIAIAVTVTLVLRIGGDNINTNVGNNNDGNNICPKSTSCNITNNPPPEPVSEGRAQITDAAPTDGGETYSPDVRITYDVLEMPNNGGALFLVCHLLDDPQPQKTWFVKAKLDNVGAGSWTGRFGGMATSTPAAMLGSKRECSVASVDGSAAFEFESAIQSDEAVILPGNGAFLPTKVQIKIDRMK